MDKTLDQLQPDFARRGETFYSNLIGIRIFLMSSGSGKIRIDMATHRDYRRALSAEMNALCEKTTGEKLRVELENMRGVFGKDFTEDDARRIIQTRINRLRIKEEIADTDYLNGTYRIQFTVSTDSYETLDSVTKSIRADALDLGGTFTQIVSQSELSLEYEIIFRD